MAKLLGIKQLFPRTANVETWDYVHKFGSCSLASAGSVWSAGGYYPWSALNVPQILFVSSTVNGDDGSVEIQGLDTNWQLLTETVSLAGSPSQITTTNTFRRVFRMIYSETNTGVITARTVSHAGTIVAQIDATKAQTLMAVYTIPSNKTGYLLKYTAGVAKGDDTHLQLFMRENQNNDFRIKSEIDLYQNNFIQDFSVPIKILPKTDIDFRVTQSAGGGNSRCTVNFDLVMDGN